MANATLLCKCHGVRQPRESLIKTPRGKFCSYELAIEFANKQTVKRHATAARKVKDGTVRLHIEIRAWRA